MLVAAPAPAHKGKEHGKAAPAASIAAPAEAAASAAPGHAQNPEVDPAEEIVEGRPSKSTMERLLNWLGRLHPMLIHFPLAFFPAALLTAIVGRRRPSFAAPVRFLIIAGGVTAPIAMALGWLEGGLALSDTDPLLQVHRWLGTVIGAISLGLALWAWKRPEQHRSAAMLIGLAALTLALMVQGWYGGALVHGADHLNW
jgi:uncharacterized membrane protein